MRALLSSAAARALRGACDACLIKRVLGKLRPRVDSDSEPKWPPSQERKGPEEKQIGLKPAMVIIHHDTFAGTRPESRDPQRFFFQADRRIDASSIYSPPNTSVASSVLNK